MRTLPELIEQLDKMMTDAYDKRRNHAYIKGLRDAKKLLEEEMNLDDDC